MSHSEMVIETTALTRRFGDVLAVDGVDLAVPRQGVYAFLGPNGAGKTTTIRMLLGLIRPHQGEVRLFGRPLGRERRQLMRRVGALVETPSLYPHLTGRENLEVTRRLLGAERRRIDQVLETVGLAGDAHRRTSGYSLGMRQRLGLALALLGEPELLILDEPTNGLDPAGIHEMRRLVSSLPDEHGVSVFLSSHLLAEVEQMADYIGIVLDGRLTFQGSLAELKSERAGFVELGLDRPGDAAAVLDGSGFASRPAGDGHLHVTPRDPSRDLDPAALGQLNAALVGQGFRIHHLSFRQPTLESLFLRMTEGSA